MRYSKNHSEEHCDKCQKKCGKENLFPVPYLYCDKNDHQHEDVSYLIGVENQGYRQYMFCAACKKIEDNITDNRHKAMFGDKQFKVI